MRYFGVDLCMNPNLPDVRSHLPYYVNAAHIQVAAYIGTPGEPSPRRLQYQSLRKHIWNMWADREPSHQ